MKDPNLPRSGPSALAAGALVQAVLGAQFVLGGLNKLADPQYVAHFRDFMAGSAAQVGGPLAWLIRELVLSNVAVTAQLARFTELGAGLVLVLGAAELVRRRLRGRPGQRHGYEPFTALASALAALVLAALSLTLYLLQGGALPRVSAGLALGPPVAIELFNVPVALAVAWMELGRFLVLRRAPTGSGTPSRRVLKAVVTGLLVLALAACGGATSAGTAGGQPAGTTKVAMSEFKFAPGSIDVQSGATLYLVNDGSRPHDMIVTNASGAIVARSSLVQPGSDTTFAIGSLAAGDYAVYCDVPGHKDAGMTGKLTVS